MTRLSAALLLAASARLAAAATAQVFAPPSTGPLVQTANYTSFSNSTLKDKPSCQGRAFNRFIQIWLENTDFATTASTPLFESLAEQGILLTNYNGVTHPSEPNYVSSAGGDFFGLADDNMYHIPSNISCIVDLLEERDVTWATYQENMPTDSYYGYSYSATNYISPSSPAYPYYMRKHDPLIIYDSVSQDAERVKRIRTFNDFANDVVHGILPQWVSMMHTIPPSISLHLSWSTGSSPLLSDPRVNDEETLILLTFDETETYTIQNTVYSLLLGGAVPLNLRGTSDDTLYTHYSSLTTVQANWDLMSLGRQDTVPDVSNVFQFVAEKVGHKNTKLPANEVPQFNLTAVASGPLSSQFYVPFSAPNVKAKTVTGRPVLTPPGLNLKLTESSLPKAREDHHLVCWRRMPLSVVEAGSSSVMSYWLVSKVGSPSALSMAVYCMMRTCLGEKNVESINDPRGWVLIFLVTVVLAAPANLASGQNPGRTSKFGNNRQSLEWFRQSPKRGKRPRAAEIALALNHERKTNIAALTIWSSLCAVAVPTMHFEIQHIKRPTKDFIFEADSVSTAVPSPVPFRRDITVHDGPFGRREFGRFYFGADCSEHTAEMGEKLEREKGWTSLVLVHRFGFD
ncbi:Phosphoesterase-domain-containing protein [Mycena sanguinolenta]|uniref:Phosphoesterase-domain-containing protein n=1 Tax=Mycena sanguinolenta TaxID=230812 RepID=A0A8H7D678_9AGAR|nr:Phosphoesterase-domain-containing protein [Mycena sanguinolenta]